MQIANAEQEDDAQDNCNKEHCHVQEEPPVRTGLELKKIHLSKAN